MEEGEGEGSYENGGGNFFLCGCEFLTGILFLF